MTANYRSRAWVSVGETAGLARTPPVIQRRTARASLGVDRKEVPKYSAQVTRVTIDLKPLPTGCELTLTHEGVLPEWLESGREGWSSILGGLSAFLTDEAAV